MSITTTPIPVPVDRTKARPAGLRVWFQRGLLGLLATVFALSGLGAIYEAVAETVDQRAYPPPGQFVDVGNRRLHMRVMGNDTGRPTVLLETGIATFSSNWAWVQNELAASTRVVAYDRAGLGWSDPAPEPHDAQQSAQDLHAALQAAGIHGPYVVVGHSYGGLVVRAFTDLYPDEVVGMVLADASHPDQWARIPESNDGRTVAAGNLVTGYLARLGAIRLFGLSAALYAGLPEQPAAEIKAMLARPHSWSTSGNVIALWGTRTRAQVNQARSLGALPLAVLSATERPDFGKAEMNAQQADLVTLSSNSLHLPVAGATHEGLVARSEYAQVVVDAILRVMEAAQTGQPLK